MILLLTKGLEKSVSACSFCTQKPPWVSNMANSSETHFRMTHCVSDKSLAELQKSHAAIGSGEAMKRETLQALRSRWRLPEKTGILSPSITSFRNVRRCKHRPTTRNRSATCQSVSGYTQLSLGRHLSRDAALFFHVVWGYTEWRQRGGQTAKNAIFHLIFFLNTSFV